MKIVETNWKLKSGRFTRKVSTKYTVDRDRIVFLESAFAFKDDIKSMKGARWNPEDKVWSVANCGRNRVQMEFLEGKNPLAWFDRPVQEHTFSRENLAKHQHKIANAILTYHYQILACDAGVGKTLPQIEAIEQSGVTDWWWACPARNVDAIDAEFFKWGLNVPCEIISLDELKNRARDGAFPQGLVIDESHKCKTASTRRTQAAQEIADNIRKEYGYDGYVNLLTGTFSPNQPIDVWSQAEIAWPGFLKEGSPKALLRRLAHLSKANPDQGFREDIIGWKEDEVELLFKRLKGLMTVVRREETDWTLPPISERQVELRPSDDVTRVAKAIVNTECSAASAAIKLREISDGFNYVQEEDGLVTCPSCKGTGKVIEWADPEDPDRQYKAIDMFTPETISKLREVEAECFACTGTGEVMSYKKVAFEVPCPKEDALREELQGINRVLVFAGFRGSLDRCVRVAQEEGWDIVRCDGRGFRVLGGSRERPLRYWMDTETNKKVAYISHPESGATSFTLTEANKVIFYSNTHRHDHREQAIARVYRFGQEKPVEVVDLIHLPTDRRVLEVVSEKKRLEGMTLGEFVGESLS